LKFISLPILSHYKIVDVARWQATNPKGPTGCGKCALSTVVNVTNAPQINKSGGARVSTILFIIYGISRKGTQSQWHTWLRLDSAMSLHEAGTKLKYCSTFLLFAHIRIHIRIGIHIAFHVDQSK